MACNVVAPATAAAAAAATAAAADTDDDDNDDDDDDVADDNIDVVDEEPVCAGGAVGIVLSTVYVKMCIALNLDATFYFSTHTQMCVLSTFPEKKLFRLEIIGAHICRENISTRSWTE